MATHPSAASDTSLKADPSTLPVLVSREYTQTHDGSRCVDLEFPKGNILKSLETAYERLGKPWQAMLKSRYLPFPIQKTSESIALTYSLLCTDDSPVMGQTDTDPPTRILKGKVSHEFYMAPVQSHDKCEPSMVIASPEYTLAVVDLYEPYGDETLLERSLDWKEVCQLTDVLDASIMQPLVFHGSEAKATVKVESIDQIRKDRSGEDELPLYFLRDKSEYEGFDPTGRKPYCKVGLLTKLVTTYKPFDAC